MWSAVHFVVGIGAIVLATTVAAQPFGGTYDHHFVAWLSAIATGCVAFLQPEQRHVRFAKAWSNLSAEITRFRGDSSYTIDHVLKAVEEGEAAIHYEARPTPTKS